MKGYIATTLIYSCLGIIFLGIGISSIVIYTQNPGSCGLGTPQLPLWVWGTGLSYSIIGLLYTIGSVMKILKLIRPSIQLSYYLCDFISGFAVLFFCTPWVLVGINSWIGHSLDCSLSNNLIWIIASISILISMSVIPVSSMLFVFVIDEIRYGRDRNWLAT